MSLINKMLQDLDARRSDMTGGDAFGLPIRPVPARPRFHVAWLVASAIGAGFAGFVAWELLSPVPLAGRVGINHPIKQEQMTAPASVKPSPAPSPPTAPSNQDTLAPAAVSDAAVPPTTPEPHVETASYSPVASKPVPADPPPVSARATKTGSSSLTLAHTLATPPAAIDDKPVPEAPRTRKAAPVEKVALLPTRAAMDEPAVKVAPPAAVPELPKVQPAPPIQVGKQVKELSPQQRAENEYRKALSQIQQGMTADAMNGLEQVLQLDPMNASARQTLIGLLLDGKRQEEALRIARAGLNLDSAQPGLAMIAARLQVEKGELRPAIEVLEKTLPYAAERGDYRSFLAALLQRDGRHKESVEHYLSALQKAPQNGVWWMGLGISLQADQRQAEAREAYGRAKASNALSPELLAFVESRIKQLPR